MHWLGPSRYLRWLAAAIVLGAGAYVEFRPSATVPHPFAARDIAPGEEIAVEWHDVPAGLLPAVSLDGSVASFAIPAGEPLLPSHLSRWRGPPSSWWSLPVTMPIPVAAGGAVRLVDNATGETAEGIVVAEPNDDPFAIDSTALVAVPPEVAIAFAVAAAADRVTVLVAAGDSP